MPFRAYCRSCKRNTNHNPVSYNLAMGGARKVTGACAVCKTQATFVRRARC